jgi:hypothetical protein
MKNLMRSAAVYKMAILIGILFSVNALADVTVASFLNVEWSTISATSKFLIVVVIIKSWSGTMLAFFNKTLSRIEAGKTPFDSGNSDPQAFVKPQNPNP